jgi:hypothetical protein
VRPQGGPGAVCRPFREALRLYGVALLAMFDEGRGRRREAEPTADRTDEDRLPQAARFSWPPCRVASRENVCRGAVADHPGRPAPRPTEPRLAFLCGRESTARFLPGCQRQPRRGGLKPPGRWVCGPMREVLIQTRFVCGCSNQGEQSRGGSYGSQKGSAWRPKRLWATALPDSASYR